MINPYMIAAFSDELEKIASTVAQMKAADVAMKLMKSRFPGLTVAQQAAMASKTGREFTQGSVGRFSRAVDLPHKGVFTKEHRQAVSREMKAKSPTMAHVEDTYRRNPDLVNPATGKKRGRLSQFIQSQRRGQAFQVPPAPGKVAPPARAAGPAPAPPAPSPARAVAPIRAQAPVGVSV